MPRARLFFMLRIAVWVVVGACVVVFARRLDRDQVIRSFQGVDLGLALAATLVCVPCSALQGLRWGALVRGIRRVPRSTPIAALYVGQAASAFMPVGRMANAVARACSGLMAARDPGAVAQAALFSALAWSLEIAVTMLALGAFHQPHDLPHAMGVIFGINLALVIPSPPASLGNFELGAGSVLVAFGGDAGHAAAFAIGLHAIQLLPAMVMGGVMLNTFRKPTVAVPPAGAQEA